MRIGIAADHAGKDLKSSIVDYLILNDYEVVDYGVSSSSVKSVDYPDFAGSLASDFCNKKISLGITVCGTGLGMSIVANKFPGVRAGVVFDEYTARMSRLHNDTNVLSLGSRTVNHSRAIDLVKIWLTTKFEGERHITRLNKIKAIEQKNFYSC